MTEKQKEWILFGLTQPRCWLAKDEDGNVYLHMFYKPYKSGDNWVNEHSLYKCINSIKVDKEDCFPDLSWEDEEPFEIKNIAEIIGYKENKND